MVVSCIWLFLILPYVWGNTEKTIFLGPPPVNTKSAYPTLNHLPLISLSPDQFTVRTYLKTEFPNNELEDGTASWLLLHNLSEGQRYEVRVCWAATQPTVFKLEAYELETVSQTPDLISELSAYASTLHLDVNNRVTTSARTLELGVTDSILLLRVLAAADFYTTNHTMMTDAPSVFVDIILDPFMLNLFPRSLSSSAACIAVVTIVSWLVGKWASSWICQIVTEPTKQKYQ
ncbi:hypothetical protein SAMD00023353_0501960 [Rosellinia necatrix]|uniref:Uncharacterized protein n=1 Tax=Rosellinia necatrix TaxID=77044 RepID=A0A1S8A651_ROSNE|nr:hypothetical protein SAMD00023353_0501960 [Rosellinia necatrix]